MKFSMTSKTCGKLIRSIYREEIISTHSTFANIEVYHGYSKLLISRVSECLEEIMGTVPLSEQLQPNDTKTEALQKKL